MQNNGYYVHSNVIRQHENLKGFFSVMKQLFAKNIVHSNSLMWGIFLPIRIVTLGGLRVEEKFLKVDVVLARSFREIQRLERP